MKSSIQSSHFKSKQAVTALAIAFTLSTAIFSLLNEAGL